MGHCGYWTKRGQQLLEREDARERRERDEDSPRQASTALAAWLLTEVLPMARATALHGLISQCLHRCACSGSCFSARRTVDRI